MTPAPLPSPQALSPLGRWFAVLAGLASLAALQASLLPRWPRAAPLEAAVIVNRLRQAGLQPEPIVLQGEQTKANRSREIAVSAPLAFRLPGGEELRVVRGTVRHRLSLQAAAIASKSEELTLKKRRLIAGPPPSAEGRIGGRPAIQTCLVPEAPRSSPYGVTNRQLLFLVDQAARGWEAELRRLLGLQANRSYSCVLISLRSGGPGAVPWQVWDRTLTALAKEVAAP
jgi:hypothetical protein